MCLATVYGRHNEEDETILLRNTTKIVIDGENITAYDIIGTPIQIKGVITEIDLMDSFVKIRQTD